MVPWAALVGPITPYIPEGQARKTERDLRARGGGEFEGEWSCAVAVGNARPPRQYRGQRGAHRERVLGSGSVE